MQHVKDTGHPPGTIVVAANFQARWYEFSSALEQVRVPDGTKLNLAQSCDIAHNFNQGIRHMGGEWVWFMGDDHTFHPDIILKLLDRDLPIVQPLVIAKIAPFRPCIMHGPYVHVEPNQSGMPVYRWDELPTTGLWALPRGDFVGQAGMLIKKEVLDDIGDPWFMPGQLQKDRLQEDLHFCQRLQEKGYTLWQDCDQVLGHVGHIEVIPKFTENGWMPCIRSGGRMLALPGLVKEQVSKFPDINKGTRREPLKWEKADEAKEVS